MMEESDSDQTEISGSEMSDSSQSSSNASSSTSTSQNKKKKGSLAKKPIAVVGRVLKNLVDDEPIMVSNKSSKGTNTKGRAFFCIEDTFLTKDIKVHVEGMGQISFPLEKDSIEQMIKFSSKAKFGKGRETVMDTNVRDTQTIPAIKLKIEINNSSLDDLLKRIGTGLNIGKNCKLIPHLHNLLIYGPGQFFKKHTDSEKVQNMIATLVIVLPYPHEGGELIIEHNNKKHMFFGSKNPDIAKCVAFYSDCAHEIKKVSDGYRVAVTYNIVLQPTDIPETTEAEISESLDVAMDNYFKSGERKLAFGLNHSYSRKSLRWDLLKGADRIRVNALVAVAKKQGRIPCLALTTYHEIYDKENTYYCPWESPTLVDEETTIDYMIDDKYNELNRFTSEDDNIRNDKEYCCTRKAKELFKPYETEASGPTGNEGDTEEYWYRRACVVLWSSKWVYFQGFKEALGELHQLTKQNGMQKVLIEKINKARKDISQPRKWAEPSIAGMLVDIVIYLNDEEEAKFILGDLCTYVTNEDHISRLAQLEKMFNDQTWCDIVKIWKEKGHSGGWNSVINNAEKFVDRYMELFGTQFKSVIVEAVLEEGVKKCITSGERKSKSNYIYDRKSKESIESLVKFMKFCSLLGKKSLEESLINHIISSSLPAVTLGEVYTQLMDGLKPEHLASYDVLKDLAGQRIVARLSELNSETGWALPVKVTCKCNICSPVVSFFSSETLKKSQVIEGLKKTYDHLFEIFYCRLNMHSLPCEWSHVRQGRIHKMTFEKLPQLLEDRKKLNDDLVKFKDLIVGVKPMLFVDVNVENEDESESNPTDVSSIEITENMKVELQDDGIAGLSPSAEEVEIKSEVTEYADEIREEIPKKRQRKPKKILDM